MQKSISLGQDVWFKETISIELNTVLFKINSFSG